MCPCGVILEFQAIGIEIYFYLRYATSSMLLWRYPLVLCLRVKTRNFKQTHILLHTCISPHRYERIGRLITPDKADNAGEDLFMRGIVDITQGIFTERLGLFSTCSLLNAACSKSARTSLQTVQPGTETSKGGVSGKYPLSTRWQFVEATQVFRKLEGSNGTSDNKCRLHWAVMTSSVNYNQLRGGRFEIWLELWTCLITFFFTRWWRKPTFFHNEPVGKDSKLLYLHIGGVRSSDVWFVLTEWYPQEMLKI